MREISNPFPNVLRRPVLHSLTLRFFLKNFSRANNSKIYIDQLSDPVNKKCSPWKPPSTLPLLSRRGPRYPDKRLFQNYIGPKMTFCHFSNFCKKKVCRVDKRNILHFLNECRGFSTWFLFSNHNPLSYTIMYRLSFLGQCNAETASLPGI